MKHVRWIRLLIAAGFVLVPLFALAAFPGRPILLSAEGGPQQAAWVAYENGDVMRCRGDTGTCQTMRGLPAFSPPVSLSAEPGHAAAWVGWSNGALFRCDSGGECKVISTTAGGTSPRLPR